MSESQERFGAWTLRKGERQGWFLAKGETEIFATEALDELRIETRALNGFTYPPIAAIERLLSLRRAALAPEAQAPSGEPWRPAVGEECFYYTVGEWRLCRRLEDDDSDIPQRFEKTDRRGSSICHCNATYDGIRPLGSLPVPPSCGGEPEAAPEGSRDWLDQEIAAAERAVYALAEMAPSERDEPLEQAQERLRALEDVRDHLSPPAGEASPVRDWGAAFESLGREPEKLDAADRAVATWLAGRPAVASERPGLARLLEWARGAEAEAEESRRTSRVGEGILHYETRGYAFGECVREIEREIAALGPPSIAEDLRTPEPGAFEGAYFSGGAVVRPSETPIGRAAVREVLAELRGELVRPRSPSDPLFTGLAGLSMAADLIDRLAERFKP